MAECYTFNWGEGQGALYSALFDMYSDNYMKLLVAPRDNSCIALYCLSAGLLTNIDRKRRESHLLRPDNLYLSFPVTFAVPIPCQPTH